METQPATSQGDPWRWVFGLIGLGSLANALWMFLDPGHWYQDLPAAVPDFGPLNEHFVRDIACAFSAAGVALVWAAFVKRFRLPLVSTESVVDEVINRVEACLPALAR